MQEAASATVVMESGTTAVCRTLLTNDVGAVGEERWDGKWKHHLRFRLLVLRMLALPFTAACSFISAFLRWHIVGTRSMGACAV